MNQVVFGTVRSHDDLGLFLKNVDISLPEPRRTLIDVPGRNGALDLTYSLSPEITYKNRKITLEFAMADYQKRWIGLFSDIANTIHGKRMHVTIQPDSGHYWDAFCTLDMAQCSQNTGTVKVNLDAFPYKYNAAETTQSIVPASSGYAATFELYGMSVAPVFQATDSGCTVTFGDVTHSLPTSETSFSDIIFTEGTNEIVVTGTAGTVEVSYREGRL